MVHLSNGRWAGLIALFAAVAVSACGGDAQKASEEVVEVPAKEAVDSQPIDTVVVEGLVDTLEAAADKPETKRHADNITQFLLVDASGAEAVTRDPGEVARRLRAIGFKVEEDYSDQMDGSIKAFRKGAAGGVTKVEYDYTSQVMLQYRPEGYDNVMNVKFADAQELAAFMESLAKSGWRGKGSVYTHPAEALRPRWVPKRFVCGIISMPKTDLDSLWNKSGSEAGVARSRLCLGSWWITCWG